MERLVKLRKELNMNQADLAEKLEVSQQTISKYENGSREPDHEMLIKLSEIFNTTVDYLLGISNVKNPYEPETIAAHHDGKEFTEEELRSIEEFKEFVRRRKMEKEGK